MQWLSTLDVLFVQLMLIPFVVITVGVIFAKLAGRIFLGPLTTLILTLEINYWYFSTTLPGQDIEPVMVASWAILPPLLSLYFSWRAVSMPEKNTLKAAD